ncbi:MAG: hypothetical protein WDZ45_06135 [Flavobacteriaceae bacterium]
MKRIIKSSLTLGLLFVFFSIQGQDFPHRDGIPNPAILDGCTEAADMIGKSLLGDPCSEKSYAEQVYCYTGQWLAESLPCLYGRNTPQYTLCKSTSSTLSLNSDEQKQMKRLNKDGCLINPMLRPLYFDSKNATKVFKESFVKSSENTVLHTYSNEYKLKFSFSAELKDSKSELFVQFVLTDSNDKVISTPFLITKGKRTYLFEGCYK